jgi:Asp-tRNA(Asn)/Glu-tRNA(Gln) amidotransferase B subunit
MKKTAKILAYRGKELKTVADLQAALMDLIRDIHSGDITAKEARLIEREINVLMKKVRAQMKSGNPKNEAAVKLFFDVGDC